MFASVMRSLQVGMAAKRPRWKGYVRKDSPQSGEVMSDGSTLVMYHVIMRQRDGDEFDYRVDAAGNCEFVRCVPGTGTGSTESTKCEFDGELLSAMLASDWLVGTPADFDASASGSGVW